ncbi:hypothetical protein [Psychrilyobacter atlanticus]|nr:hypothetical protein [Psychrilyobacter atlanticus]
MKESIEKFKSDFGGLRVGAKASIIGGALTMTFVGLVNLSFRLQV